MGQEDRQVVVDRLPYLSNEFQVVSLQSIKVNNSESQLFEFSVLGTKVWAAQYRPVFKEEEEEMRSPSRARPAIGLAHSVWAAATPHGAI